jgi:hypothetical protein
MSDMYFMAKAYPAFVVGALIVGFTIAIICRALFSKNGL